MKRKYCHYVCFEYYFKVDSLLQQKEPEPLPKQLVAFGIGEKTKQGIMHLWASYQSIEYRIEALEKRAFS